MFSSEIELYAFNLLEYIWNILCDCFKINVFFHSNFFHIAWKLFKFDFFLFQLNLCYLI